MAPGSVGFQAREPPWGEGVCVLHRPLRDTGVARRFESTGTLPHPKTHVVQCFDTLLMTRIPFFPNSSLLLRVLMEVKREGWKDTKREAASVAARPGIAKAPSH